METMNKHISGLAFGMVPVWVDLEEDSITAKGPIGDFMLDIIVPVWACLISLGGIDEPKGFPVKVKHEDFEKYCK